MIVDLVAVDFVSTCLIPESDPYYSLPNMVGVDFVAISTIPNIDIVIVFRRGADDKFVLVIEMIHNPARIAISPTARLELAQAVHLHFIIANVIIRRPAIDTDPRIPIGKIVLFNNVIPGRASRYQNRIPGGANPKTFYLDVAFVMNLDPGAKGKRI